MFDKSFLVNKVVNSLLKKEFQVLISQGCFDIAAKKENLFLIKVLKNIDSLPENQALSLRSISHFLSAYPFIISVKSNREMLKNDMIYSRFDLPVLTPQLFDTILTEGDISIISSSKGRYTVTIDTDLLRNRRKEMEFTLNQLAELVSISKKALYEIENKRVNPSMGTVRKLERFLNIELKLPYKISIAKETYLEPKDEFQKKVSNEFKRIGIDNSPVYSTPFEIIGKEQFSLITGLSINTVKIKKDVEMVKKLSSVFSSKAFFVSKKSKERSLEGIPILLESELPELESSKELSKIIEEKENL